MKKIFSLAVALVAALAANAQFTGFDGTDGKLGQQIYEGLITDKTNITMDETDASAHKYNINITTGGECSFKLGGVSFWYSNSNDGTTAYKSYGTYIQPNGNKRKVTIPTTPGMKVIIGVQDEIKIAVEGVQEAVNGQITLQGWGSDKDQFNEVTATGKEIVLWSDLRDDAYTAAKFKLGVVLPGTPAAVENVATESKAIKFVENGQLVIIKNGVRYNALGARL